MRRVMTDGRSPLAGHTRHAPRHRRLSTGRGCVGSTRCQLPHTMSKASTSPAHAAPSSLSNNHLPSELRRLGPLPTRHPTHAGAHATQSCEPSHRAHHRHTPHAHPAPQRLSRALSSRQPPSPAAARGCALGSRPRPSAQSTASALHAHRPLPEPLRNPLPPPLLAQSSALPPT